MSKIGMKNLQLNGHLVAPLGLLLFLSACAQNATPPTLSIPMPSIPALSSTATATSSKLNETLSATVVAPTPTYSTAPTDPELDQTCRITITYFFSVDKSFDIEAVRNLFVPKARSMADAIAQRQTPALVLEVLPANQWWQRLYPDKPVPQFMLPERRNQYVYYAEYTGSYASKETAIAPYPAGMLVVMDSQGPYDCKIENYGWG